MPETEKLMGITIISDSEEYEFQPYPKSLPDVKIIYRRMSNTEQARIRIKHTKQDQSGRADEIAINNEVLDYGLLRFEHVYSAPGVKAPNSADTLHKLDGWIVGRVLQLVCGMIPGYIHVPLSAPSDSLPNSK